jgi:hypothetical protein
MQGSIGASVVTNASNPSFSAAPSHSPFVIRPAALVGGDDFMLHQRAAQRFGHTLVEQYAYLGSGKRAAGGVI